MILSVTKLLYSVNPLLCSCSLVAFYFPWDLVWVDNLVCVDSLAIDWLLSAVRSFLLPCAHLSINSSMPFNSSKHTHKHDTVHTGVEVVLSTGHWETQFKLQPRSPICLGACVFILNRSLRLCIASLTQLRGLSVNSIYIKSHGASFAKNKSFKSWRQVNLSNGKFNDFSHSLPLLPVTYMKRWKMQNVWNHDYIWWEWL